MAGQVLKVDHNKGEVLVKLVPRVDTNDYSGTISTPVPAARRIPF